MSIDTERWNVGKHNIQKANCTVSASPALLLKEYIHLFKPNEGHVIDLACGRGQNGLFLKQSNISPLFADINSEHLKTLQNENDIPTLNCWHADFESDVSGDSKTLTEMRLQGAIVFRYLHRPLFPFLKLAIKPGGIIIYETFTEANRQFGRPNRSDFLLKENELKNIFEDWELLFYFEGIKHQPDRAIAQIVVRKPLSSFNKLTSIT